ncbi:aspartyl-tRNA amidotransferase subunit B [Ciceribacter naphthalenivorans]|uniref:Aspartyl-tRNA amidotransferase subunit B n=3 Tax=Alphaproteobacteria TaxID=28211 RepID=A0A512HEK0_9HYPH|nr:GatB/YqeY domain-containing protein [Sphingomonas psychrolutea]GEO83872.1 aspartyl-tRNA amidotransferase subunit B [Ciceribacter naphthalenivorans]GLR21250.1 aspartyl-tRNA amidotransferase subunit B [Ciceribacter naphthalenivorans]GLT04106.1 aspartyl-tRNA amidotransferase subunit B [Sphingomonas psychrolutea]
MTTFANRFSYGDEEMMRDRLTEVMKESLKAKDVRRTSTVRLIQTAIKDRDIANRGIGKDPVTDDEIMQILMKMIKQRDESAKIYADNARPELAEQELQEICIIKSFMPEQLPEEKVRELCASVITETGAQGLRDMGKCMNALKERYPGQIDFAKASGLVKDLLK